MAPSQKSSGSEQGSTPMTIDSKKQKRMHSNRESARRSRMKKQQHLDELLGQVTRLKNENQKVAMQIDMLTQNYNQMESDNMVRRAQLKELTERLRSLNSVLNFVSEFGGMEMDISEIPEPCLEPWQFPCPSHQMPACADMFRS